MHRTLWALPVWVLLLPLSACETTLSLQLPVGTPLDVSIPETHSHYTLAPDSDEYGKLALWIQRNQSGWSRYLITAPICGICVSTGGVQLNFLGPSVIVFLKDGGWHKPVPHSDYAFLKR